MGVPADDFAERQSEVGSLAAALVYSVDFMGRLWWIDEIGTHTRGGTQEQALDAHGDASWCCTYVRKLY
jgi:hypothetical protein